MSSNQTTSSRTMSGIISIYSDDIAVNRLDANEIEVDDLTINNSLLVNNITLSPDEISQLTGINTDETIQTQINNITGDLGTNYVDLTSSQTISGAKTFSATTTLTGNLNVNSTNITPLELSYLDGATSNLQDQINNAVVGMTLDTDQVATGFKQFVNGIESPFINNQETTGSINGYFTNSSDFIYTTKTGVFNVGTSVISGIDCVNQLLTALSDSSGSISPATIARKGEVFTCEYYITDTNIITVNTNSNQIQVDQGIQFLNVSDFVSVINGYEITLLYSTSLTLTPATTLSSYILNGKLITDSNVNGQHFIEGNGLTKPVQINASATLEYNLQTPNPVIDTPITTTTQGFNYNDKNWTFLDYTATIADQDYTTGTNITLGTRLENLTADKYDYNISVVNDTPYYTVQGFYYSNRVWIYTGTNTIAVDDGIFDITHGEYAYVSIVQNDNVYTIGKNDFNVQTAISDVAYINSNLQLISIVDYTGKFTSENTITSVDSADIVPNVYNISSEFTITATNPQIVQYAYKYDANTLILENNNFIVGPFLFELPTLPAGSNQYGSYSATFDKVNTVINSNYVSPATTGSSAVIFTFGSDIVIYFGHTTNSGHSKFIVNNNLTPVNTVSFTEPLSTASYNGQKIVANGDPLTETQPLINTEMYLAVSIGGTTKFIFGTTQQANLNDIIKGSTPQTGRYITSKTQSFSFNISGLYIYTLNYSQAPSTPKQSGLSWTQAKYSNTIITPTNGFIQVGDFVNYDSGDVWGYITSIQSSGFFNIELTVDTFAYGALSGNDLAIYDHDGFMSVYRPQAIDIYDAIRCDVYEVPIDFYDKVDYGFFNKTTNNIYTPVSYNQYQRANAYFYSNNVYTATTSTQIDLPAVALPDTFVVEDFAQTLSQKTFSDNTSFQADITVNNTITCQYLNASIDISCRDISCRDLTASRDVNSVDFNGTGLLTLSDDEKEHIISNNLYIGRLFSATSNNYGIGIGGTTWTDAYNNNTFILTKNVSNNITVVNSPTEVWSNINNNLRLKVADQAVEFYPAGNLRFYVDNAITTLFKTDNTNARIDCFATNSNGYIDFQTSNTTDYAVRINASYTGSTNGNGSLNFTANRSHLYNSNGTRQIDFGYLDSNSSFIRGRGTTTWINFHSNKEIYWYLNGSTRITFATNGYIYAPRFVTTSDRRLKSNIVDVSNALQTINTLEVKEFDKKCSMCCDEDGCEEISHEIGFIAQQIEETDLSFCVSTSQLNDTKGLKDSCIYALNVKATQELYALVMKQQEEINSLKERLSYLNI